MITMAGENVRLLVIRSVSTIRTFTLVSCPGCPSKAKPMLAPFASVIASVAYIERSVIALRAVIVQLVLDILLATVHT